MTQASQQAKTYNDIHIAGGQVHLGDVVNNSQSSAVDVVLQSLWFEDLHTRQEQVTDAHKNTCRWIFAEKLSSYPEEGQKHAGYHSSDDDSSDAGSQHEDDDREDGDGDDCHDDENEDSDKDSKDDASGNHEDADDDDDDDDDNEEDDDHDDNEGRSCDNPDYDQFSDIIESIAFDTIADYYSKQTDRAHSPKRNETFKEVSDCLPWDNFVDWLRHGESVYWISGKAGSGKSTLMNYIVQSDRTMEELEAWAGDCELCIPSYFFWRAGTALQKNQLGLLRSLLHQILEQHEDLVGHVIDREPSKRKSKSRSLPALVGTWTLPRLTKSLIALLNQTSKSLKFCFFIDGLDEFEGVENDLLELLDVIRTHSNAKLCVASRPLHIYETSFRDAPKLRVQDFNGRDIIAYIDDKFSGSVQMSHLLKEDPGRIYKFVRDIRQKADGVFLWVKLAVEDLLVGLTNEDSMNQLEFRLDRLKPELRQLFEQMFRGIDPLYVKESITFLSLVMTTFTEVSFVDIAFAQDDGFANAMYDRQLPVSETSLQRGFDRIRTHIITRCAGLLEIHRTPGESVEITSNNTEDEAVVIRTYNQNQDCKLAFVHRSAYEYLLENEDFNETCRRLAVTNLDCYNLHIRGWLRRITIDPLTPKLQSTLMQYAHAIELLSQEHQAVVMHQIRRAVVSADRISREDFHNFLDDQSFFNSCASYGLQRFITYTFDNGEHLAYDVDPNDVLSAALDSLNEDLEIMRRGRGPDDPKELAVRMAEFRNIAITMLHHGASPNHIYDLPEWFSMTNPQRPILSLWHYFLSVMWQAFRVFHKKDGPQRFLAWDRNDPFDAQTFGEVAEAFLTQRPCLDFDSLSPVRGDIGFPTMPILKLEEGPGEHDRQWLIVRYSPLRLLLDCLHAYASLKELEAAALAQGAHAVRKLEIWLYDSLGDKSQMIFEPYEDEERVLNQELGEILVAKTARQHMTAAREIAKEVLAIRQRHRHKEESTRRLMESIE